MNYSGKTDPKGFFIGRDRFGSNIIVDFDRRAADKTNASALILGNTGQGKSYLLKLLLCNVREAGKSVISLDSEHEMEDECRALGGCFLDYLSGQYRINLLEPRCWDDGSGPEDPDAPDAFRGTLLSQHISFLRDVFRVYKGFDTPHIDTLELMVERLYQKWNITDRTDFASMRPENYPILSDLYDAIQESYDHYEAADSLYPREMLRDLLLGLHSMCRGADARFFNGHTNITNSKFLVFCVKGLDNMAENLRNTLLFSLLSYMSDQLLTLGNSVAAIDELYLWLSDPTVITYIRNALNFYMDADFDVDAAFGTFVLTDKNDDWLNIYANYDIAEDRPCDTLELCLCKGDGAEESWSYPLNAAEQDVLLRKMEAFCQQQIGMSLCEYAQQLREEQAQTSEMQM